ncbi:hypothetical protein BaRGS_00005015 [Batillaria attramentaria]|uniref:Uncharacterized protein n=1 Tax=Batillaria attramentaria TaxID=370345 RepID=A0ABD0LY52_9CAEN
MVDHSKCSDVKPLLMQVPNMDTIEVILPTGVDLLIFKFSLSVSRKKNKDTHSLPSLTLPLFCTFCFVCQDKCSNTSRSSTVLSVVVVSTCEPVSFVTTSTVAVPSLNSHDTNLIFYSSFLRLQCYMHCIDQLYISLQESVATGHMLQMPGLNAKPTSTWYTLSTLSKPRQPRSAQCRIADCCHPQSKPYPHMVKGTKCHGHEKH